MVRDGADEGRAEEGQDDPSELSRAGEPIPPDFEESRHGLIGSTSYRWLHDTALDVLRTLDIVDTAQPLGYDVSRAMFVPRLDLGPLLKRVLVAPTMKL